MALSVNVKQCGETILRAAMHECGGDPAKASANLAEEIARQANEHATAELAHTKRVAQLQQECAATAAAGHRLVESARRDGLLRGLAVGRYVCLN